MKTSRELSTASEEPATEEVTEEVVDSALENAEETDEVVTNNDADEEELTLKQKFKQAFTKEHVTVNY